MLTILSIIRLLFPKMPPSDKQWKVWRNMRDKQIVQQYARGNLRLRMGHYITEIEIESKKAAILKYKF